MQIIGYVLLGIVLLILATAIANIQDKNQEYFDKLYNIYKDYDYKLLVDALKAYELKGDYIAKKVIQQLLDEWRTKRNEEAAKKLLSDVHDKYSKNQ